MNLVRNQYGVAVELPGSELLPIGHIIGVGRNYVDHAHEQGAKPPKRPMTFTKNPASAILDRDDIIIPKICQDRPQVDFEGELALIIGKPCRDVSEDEAADPDTGCILGFCCANDVSARWWQKEGAGGQFNRGKSFDTFCPLGPNLVSHREVGDPLALRVKTTVSDEVMQDAPTSAMTFAPAFLVSELSRGTTLLPGTVILTGTPSGVGMARDPQRFLVEGDIVQVEITDLGRITNRVRLES